MQHEIADIKKQTTAKEKHCQKLAVEQRRLVFHRQVTGVVEVLMNT